MAAIRALVATRRDSGLEVDYRELSDSDLGEGDVEVAVEYTTLNFKDGLAMTDAIPIVQKSPLILGIDMAGTITASDSNKFRVGDRVVLNGYGASETRNGGYTERLRTSSDLLVKLPQSISTREAMAIGTAGYTAMLSVLRLERLGISPDRGDVLVTGASGGVGTIAISLLTKLGYRVTASTGRMEEEAFLKSLGAKQVIHRDELSSPGDPMQSTRWAAAVDSCGSHTLANVLAQLDYNGVVTACGLAQGTDLPATVLPFALRNVALLGVDSVNAPMPLREQAWSRLEADLDRSKLDSLSFDLPFDQLKKAGPEILAGKIRGRAIVSMRSQS